MKQVATTFVAMICFAAFAWKPGDAQQPLPKPITITIKNLTGVNMNVQGASFIGGVVRKGNIMLLKGNGVAYEQQVLGGMPRFFTAADPLQPNRIYLAPSKVDIPNRNVTLKVMISPTNPKMLVIVPE